MCGPGSQHLVAVTPRDAVRHLVREVGAALRDTVPACPPGQGLEILMPPLLSSRNGFCLTFMKHRDL